MRLWSLDHGGSFYHGVYVDTDKARSFGDYEVRIVFNDCLGYRYMETFDLIVEKDETGRSSASIEYVGGKTMIEQSSSLPVFACCHDWGMNKTAQHAA